MKIVTYSLCMLALLLSSCNTTNPGLDRAASLYQKGDRRGALQQYEAIAQGDLSRLDREFVQQQQSKIRTEIVEDALRLAESKLISGVPPEKQSVEPLQAAVEVLEGALPYDTGDRRVEAALAAKRTLLHGALGRTEEKKNEAARALSRGDWSGAMSAIVEAESMNPTSREVENLVQRIFQARRSHYETAARGHFEQSELDKLRVLVQQARRESPPLEATLLKDLETDLERLREDLLPAEIDALISVNRLYEACQKLATSDRASTLKKYQDLRDRTVEHYASEARAALNTVPRAWGKAYFSFAKAQEIAGSQTDLTELSLPINRHLDEGISVKLGVASFDSPGTRTNAGQQFADGLVSYLNERLPYGVSLADRARIDRLLLEKDSIREQAFEREDIGILIRGNLSVLDVERKRNEFEDKIFVEIGSEYVSNPEYDTYKERYGARISSWPKELRDTPVSIEQPKMEALSLAKTHEYAQGLMVLSASIVDARTNTVIESFDAQEEYRNDDVYHGAIPAAGIQADPPELASDFEIIEQMRTALVERVANRILNYYDSRERSFYQRAQEALKRRAVDEALEHMAMAHRYCLEAYTDEALANNTVFQEISRSALLDYSERASSTGDGLTLSRPVPENSRVPMPTMARAQENGNNQWALVVGVSDYEDDLIPDLDHAATDALAVHEWLISPEGGGLAPDRAKLLIGREATFREIRRAFSSWLASASPDSTVTVFLAGHGSPATPERPEDVYFIPYDAEYSDIAATSIHMGFFAEAFSRLVKVENVLILADTCHSGGMGVGAGFAPGDGDTRHRAIKIPGILASNLANEIAGSSRSNRIAILSSSKPDEVSQESSQWGGGVFTQYVLRGLSFRADSDEDGVVTAEELYEYVSKGVYGETNGRQNPVIEGQNFSDLVVCRLIGTR